MKKPSTWGFALLLSFINVTVTLAQLSVFKDINVGFPSDADGLPQQLTKISNLVYFSSTTADNGRELWVTDGTASGTRMVKDIYPGLGNASPAGFVALNNFVYFIATDGPKQQALWKTDGTSDGTVLVKRLPYSNLSSPVVLTTFNGSLYFFWLDALWKSDGLEAGTSALISNISEHQYLTVSSGALYFSCRKNNLGAELWKTDGTAAGTVMVKDINVGAGGSSPHRLMSFKGALYFVASNPANGAELWKTDGTEVGTVMVKDIVSGPNGSNIGGVSRSRTHLEAVGDFFYFSAIDPATGNHALWKSDGTEAGTIKVKGGFFFFESRQYNGRLYFAANDRLYTSDGTEAGTVQVSTPLGYSVNVAPVPKSDGLFYEAYLFEYGFTLWKVNPNGTSTEMVKDIDPLRKDNNSYTVGSTAVLDDKLIFAGRNKLSGWELWTSDGTEAGTMLLKETNTQGNSDAAEIFPIGNKFLFCATSGIAGRELWQSDGTSNGTVLLKDLNPNGNGSPYGFTEAGSKIFFFADNGVNGHELWQSNGTAEGTVMVKEIITGTAGVINVSTASANGLFFFAPTVDSGTRKLWRSDGTAEGTYEVFSSPEFITWLTSSGNRLYFSASDGIKGRELWTSDGTAAGTRLVKDINSSGGSDPGDLIEFKGKLLFYAFDPANGFELWKSDGTEQGTTMVKSISTLNTINMSLRNYDFPGQNIADNFLYFSANDGTNGTELWKTDGTAEGTMMVKDITAASSFSSPSDISVVNGIVYFIIEDGLWKSDGTATGTMLVKDDLSMEGSEDLDYQLAVVGNKLYVAVRDYILLKSTLWLINESSACLMASNEDLQIYKVYKFNGDLYTTGKSLAYGVELFKHTATADGICKKQQTITFAPLPVGKRVGNESFTISATATSNLAVTFTSSNPAVASVSGSSIALVSPGETTITASQAGDNIWAPAPSVTQTLVVDVVLSAESEIPDVASIFPNPFNESFTLRVNTASIDGAITIYSVHGELMESLSFPGKTDTVLGGEWPNGIYILRLNTNNKLYTMKLVKK